MIVSPSGKIKFKPNFKSRKSYNFSAKKIILPSNWWHSDHSYQSLIKNKQIEKTPHFKRELDSYKYSLPKPNYWEIKQGDYKKKCEAKYNLDNINIKKDLLSAGFSIAVIVSVLIIIAFSYLVARI